MNSYFGTARLIESWEIVILEQQDSEILGDRYSGTLPEHLPRIEQVQGESW